ncbi:MAG: phosphatase [Bacteroidota bacterium]
MPETTHRLAVIDMGSNAIRLQISNVRPNQRYARFKRLEYVRFPLRLGNEAFKNGTISEKNVERILKLMHSYKLLMELYEVEDYMACATSAMREASNGKEIVAQIREDYRIDLEVISGQRESEVLGKSIEHLTKKGSFMHVDVGGGSTEINFYEDGQKLSGRSFPLGGVRQLRQDKDTFDREEMEKWIQKQALRLQGAPCGIGTGGNINKLRSLLNKKETVFIPYGDLKAIHADLCQISYEERMSAYHLNPDRADVIVPAGQIYMDVMDIAHVDRVIVPNVGLREGMLRLLLERNQIPTA